jgi:exodeoxyribonuclease VII small subunit
MTTSPKKSFRQLESELEQIIQKVESKSYEELDDLLQDYAAGKKMIAELESRLEHAKNTIIKAKKS